MHTVNKAGALQMTQVKIHRSIWSSLLSVLTRIQALFRKPRTFNPEREYYHDK
jgi:hypothetical protein